MLTRRHFLSSSTAALAAGSFGLLRPSAEGAEAGRISLFAQQQAPPPVTPLFKELRRNTGYWTARGGTIGWLINPGGVVAVDSQFPDTAALCIDELLKKSGKTTSPR